MNSLQVTFKRDISNRTTDLAEIFMNILVTHKIPFYFTENTERQSIKKNQFKTKTSLQSGRSSVHPFVHSVCKFISLSECNEFECGDSTIYTHDVLIRNEIIVNKFDLLQLGLSYK